MTKATVRPSYWTGVDAQAEFGGKFPINWMEIDLVAEELDHDPCEVYAFYMSLAAEAQAEGDNKECAACACQGLAALNYLMQEVA